jgi:hypothetical protein
MLAVMEKLGMPISDKQRKYFLKGYLGERSRGYDHDQTSIEFHEKLITAVQERSAWFLSVAIKMTFMISI